MRHLRIMRYVDQVARTGSIRKAADQLNVTASAVNRRIMDLEEELGTDLFERRARGVRLTAAGEVFVDYLRRQDGDVERMKSQIEDFRVCGAATSASLAARRWRSSSCRGRSANSARSIPWCRLTVKVLDHEQAMAALASYEVDLVLVFRPPFLANFQPLMTLEQRLVAVMAADHPLAGKDGAAARLRRLSRGAGGTQHRRPAIAGGSGGPQPAALQRRRRIQFVRDAARPGHAREPDLVPDPHRHAGERQSSVVAREIDDRDVPRANLVLGQLARAQSADAGRNVRRAAGARLGRNAEREPQPVTHGRLV